MAGHSFTAQDLAPDSKPADQIMGQVPLKFEDSPLLRELHEQQTPDRQLNRPMGIVHEEILGRRHPEEHLYIDPPHAFRHWFERPDPLERLATPEQESKPVTEADREAVRTKMEAGVNELIPADQKAALKQFRDGIIDADPKKIQEAFNSMKGNPDLMHVFVRELNGEFGKQGSTVKFSMTENNTLLVSSDGKNGVEFGPQGPHERSVTRGDDGYIYPSQNGSNKSTVEAVMGEAMRSTCAPPESLYFSDPYKIHLHHRYNPAEIIDKSK